MKHLCWLFCLTAHLALAQGPKVLLVTAHPDDETTFPVTVYKITHDLGGVVDLMLLTDGQGGYNGAELGAQYYGYSLYDSIIGRERLPAIRKQELLNAGRIMGIRNYFFADQADDGYTRDPAPYVTGIKWDTALINKKLDQVLAKTPYDFVILMLPNPEQHGHHKTATLVALRAIQRLKGPNKPVVLAGKELDRTQKFAFTELPGYPETRISSGTYAFSFDRAARWGHENKLSYLIVADWVTNEYKSQGDLQNNGIHTGELETFWYFDLNGPGGMAKAKALFEAMRQSGVPGKSGTH